MARGFLRSVILRLDRAAAERMELETKRSLKDAGEGGADAFESAMKEGGTKAARALRASLRAELNRTMAEARVQLAQGSISPEQFTAKLRGADQTFNRGMLQGMEQLRREGKLTEAQYASLARQLRLTGTAGRHSAEVTATGWRRATATIRGAVIGLQAMIAPLLAIFAGGMVARFLLDTNRAAESLQAQLKVTEGGAEQAGAVFRQIEEFARATPFQIEDVTKAFLDLRASGIGPTEQMMRSFGDLASARGKNITDFTGAVQDAVTGEMERLKEFGIVAKKQGSDIAFTFNGQTTVVNGTRDAILAYLESAGEATGVQGAMAEQMGTLNGVISNLWDNLGTLARTIGEEGLNGELKGAIGSTIEFTGYINENRVVIGQWTRAIVAAVALVVQSVAVPIRILSSLVLAIKDTLMVALATVIGGAGEMALAIGKSVNWVVDKLNHIPGVNIRMRMDTSEVQKQVDTIWRNGSRALRDLKEQNADIGDAIGDWGRSAAGAAKALAGVGEAGDRVAAKAKNWGAASGTITGSGDKDGDSAGKGGGGRSKGERDAMLEEIGQLRQMSELRRLNTAETARLAELEREIGAALGAAVLTRERELDLRGKLRDVGAIIAAERGRELQALRGELELLERAASLRGLSVREAERLREIERALQGEAAESNAALERRLALAEEIERLRRAPAPAAAAETEMEVRFASAGGDDLRGALQREMDRIGAELGQAEQVDVAVRANLAEIPAADRARIQDELDALAAELTGARETEVRIRARVDRDGPASLTSPEMQADAAELVASMERIEQLEGRIAAAAGEAGERLTGQLAGGRNAAAALADELERIRSTPIGDVAGAEIPVRLAMDAEALHSELGAGLRQVAAELEQSEQIRVAVRARLADIQPADRQAIEAELDALARELSTARAAEVVIRARVETDGDAAGELPEVRAQAEALAAAMRSIEGIEERIAGLAGDASDQLAHQLDDEERLQGVRAMREAATEREISGLRESTGLRRLMISEQARLVVLQDETAARIRDAAAGSEEHNRLLGRQAELRAIQNAPLEQEIGLLGEAAQLRRLTPDERGRAKLLLAQLDAQLALVDSAEEELRIRRQISGVRSALGVGEPLALTDFIEGGLESGIASLTDTFGDFFSALADGFDESAEGFQSMADAAIGVGASIVGSLLEGLAEYALAQGALKLAESLWPPNPVALAAAAAYFAAAGLLKGVASQVSGAGRSSGSASVPHSTRDPGLGRAERAERAGAEVHIYIDPLDPQNPAYQRSVYAAQSAARERYGEGANIRVHSRSGG